MAFRKYAHSQYRAISEEIRTVRDIMSSAIAAFDVLRSCR